MYLCHMIKIRYIYAVTFFSAPLPSEGRRKLFLFSSLAAIYEMFTPQQIGCSLGHLYNLRISDGAVYGGQQCIVHRERLYSKPQKSQS